jgi:hypothetical protein
MLGPTRLQAGLVEKEMRLQAQRKGASTLPHQPQIPFSAKKVDMMVRLLFLLLQKDRVWCPSYRESFF